MLLGAAAVAAGLGAAAAAGLLLGNEVGQRGVTGSGTVEETPMAGSAAPHLSGTDPVSGEAVRLSDFRGRTLVVTVWASWCPQCRRQAGPMQRFADKNRETAILGIDVQDDRVAAKDFVAAAHWTHPSIADPDGRLSARLGVAELPTTYFFTRDHRLAATASGYASLEELDAGLAQAEAAG
ncbi:MAG: TlpA disulfide reductase family protein [Gaiellaceae bacterium]